MPKASNRRKKMLRLMKSWSFAGLRPCQATTKLPSKSHAAAGASCTPVVETLT
jgi:hypothetical protein